VEKQDKQAESREQSMSIVPEISARTLLTPMKTPNGGLAEITI